MADLQLINEENSAIVVKGDRDNNQITIDINKEVLVENLIDGINGQKDDVLISYGTDIPDENTKGKIYIQI